MYLSRVTRYQDPLSWKCSSLTHLWACHPLYDFIFNLVAKVKIFINIGDIQAPHVCVIPWVSSKLVQGLLSFSHMIPPVMYLKSHWMQMYLRSLCLLSVRSLLLRIFPFIPRCFHLLHVGSCKSIWKTLRTSLQVLILHPRHHYLWSGTLLPFLLGYFFIFGRFSSMMSLNSVS